MSGPFFGSGKKADARDPTYADHQAVERISNAATNLMAELSRQPSTKPIAGEVNKIVQAAVTALLQN